MEAKAPKKVVWRILLHPIEIIAWICVALVIVLWLLVAFLMDIKSGWKKLRLFYGIPKKDLPGGIEKFSSAVFNGYTYRHIVSGKVDDSGLYLCKRYFLFFSESVFIPNSQVVDKDVQEYFRGKYLIVGVALGNAERIVIKLLLPSLQGIT